MTVYSKQSYEDQVDGRILKAERKQQYVLFPPPIAFLNDELKAELGIKSQKEEEESDAKFCSLKVPMEHEDKESKTYVVKVKKYDSGIPEEFLKWRLILNEQMENHGYSADYDMVMNLAQAMLTGRSLKEFLSQRRSQEANNRIRKAKEQAAYTPQQIYDRAIFELAICVLTSKVNGEIPLRGRENISEEIFSWENSTQKSSVKDCKTSTSIWITSHSKK
jgi:hypothetical protein